MHFTNGRSKCCYTVFSLTSLFLSSWGAQAFSLFHLPEEVEYVQASRSPQKVPTGEDLIHLSGLIYKGPKEWQLWINGALFTPELFPNLQVVKVTSKSVSLKIVSRETPLSFTLTPNQHYCMREYKVGIGRMRHIG